MMAPFMSRKFDLTSLQLFVAVCECKSIAQAAEVENITASAISKRVTQLEQLAGAPLVVRTRSGVAPTKAGNTLLEHARKILRNLDQIERDLRSTTSWAGCSPMLASAWRAPGRRPPISSGSRTTSVLVPSSICIGTRSPLAFRCGSHTQAILARLAERDTA